MRFSGNLNYTFNAPIKSADTLMRKLTFYFISISMILFLFWVLFYLTPATQNRAKIKVAKLYSDAASYEVITMDKEACWREPDLSKMTPLADVDCSFGNVALKYHKISASVNELPNGIRADVEMILPASIVNYDKKDVLANYDLSLDCYDKIERDLVLDGGVAVLKSSYWLFFDTEEKLSEEPSKMIAQITFPR